MTMKLSMVLFGLALVLGACGGGDAPKTGCDGIGTKMKEMSKKEMDEQMKGASAEEKKMMEEMKKAFGDMEGEMVGVVVKSCKEDKWSQETIDCVLKAENDDGGKECMDKLTPEQKTKMDERGEAVEKKMEEKMKGMMGG